MARRRPATTPTLPLPDGSAQTSLRLHAAGERLGALLKERERLLADVRKKRTALQAATERASSAAQEVATQMKPILVQYERLRAELAALFDELLAPGRLKAGARKKVQSVQRSLMAQGLIPEREEADPAPDPFADGATFESDFDAEAPPFSGRRPSDERVASAPQHGQSAGRDSLRTLFKRLALAVHPDRAQHEDDRERRTEAMKEATRAYEDGDLARLLELEEAWQTGSPSPSTTNDEERRCVELEQTIRELTRQRRELMSELRDLRAQVREDMLDVPVSEVVAGAEDELKELAGIRDFVKAFRDGKITLAQFVAGPELDEALPEDDAIIEIERIVEGMLQAQAATGRGSSRSKKRTRR